MAKEPVDVEVSGVVSEEAPGLAAVGDPEVKRPFLGELTTAPDIG